MANIYPQYIYLLNFRIINESQVGINSDFELELFWNNKIIIISNIWYCVMEHYTFIEHSLLDNLK